MNIFLKVMPLARLISKCRQPETMEICKMQSEVSTSLVSKTQTGMLSLTTFEKATQSLVLEQVLEIIFVTFHRTQTRPLGRAAIFQFFFLIFILFYRNIVNRLLIR